MHSSEENLEAPATAEAIVPSGISAKSYSISPATFLQLWEDNIARPPSIRKHAQSLILEGTLGDSYLRSIFWRVCLSILPDEGPNASEAWTDALHTSRQLFIDQRNAFYDHRKSDLDFLSSQMDPLSEDNDAWPGARVAPLRVPRPRALPGGSVSRPARHAGSAPFAGGV
ncbi:hypothetical protein H696_01913 [Fonticula alba]|uniref:Uncharacterized protein n=1 Tax=Fonticula alba TaxID=691883 RepID=A0A058ZAK8_FONAL|nr:hypothetical protein H696_01913 [Fonticula alba]KCV70966.1 hypothetical protein H696_01913 [Fonticula alba]|eukprot:XP_009494089.1 hypothetical protein H696_01913 [Fonticula alba]